MGRKSGQSPEQVAEGWILGCDTVVECEGRILGKPADREDARQMLRAQSGRLQRVLTGLCLWQMPQGWQQVRVAATTLRMDPLSPAQLEEYLASGQWEGKAGAFGYQDRLGWVHVLQGSESNVVGLPLELLAEMLDSARMTARATGLPVLASRQALAEPVAHGHRGSRSSAKLPARSGLLSRTSGRPSALAGR